LDSNLRHGWVGKYETSDVEPMAISEAVGFLKGEDDKAITLTMSISEFESTLEGLTIPKVSILEVKEMRVK